MTRATHKKTTVTPAEILVEMLQTKRQAGSKTLDSFIAKWIAPLGAKPDQAGNWIIRIGQSRVLWSSHTDSVHSSSGWQTLAISGDTVRLRKDSNSNCLGADCATGVWIMREMILAGVAGLYIFHADEESGGIGSGHIASTTPELLDGIDYAIAFDRKGFDSVISHQAGSRCASQAFIDSILPMLPAGFSADSGGTFTDTASYMTQVPECTNLSVGYLAQHTAQESQSLNHALAMREAMLAFDETQLIAERDPAITEPTRYDWSSYYDWQEPEPTRQRVDDLAGWIRQHPDVVADWMTHNGVDVEELRDWRDQLLRWN